MIFENPEKFNRRAFIACGIVGAGCLGAAGWILFIYVVRLICRH